MGIFSRDQFLLEFLFPFEWKVPIPIRSIEQIGTFLQLSSLDTLVMLTRHFFGGAVALSLHGKKVLILRPALQ